MFSVCFAFCIKENEWKQEGVGDIHCLVDGYKMVTQFFFGSAMGLNLNIWYP